MSQRLVRTGTWIGCLGLAVGLGLGVVHFAFPSRPSGGPPRTPKVRYDFDSPWEGVCVLRMWGKVGPKAPGEVMLSCRYRVARPTEALFEGTGWLKGLAITQAVVAKAPHYLLREVAAERGIDP